MSNPAAKLLEKCCPSNNKEELDDSNVDAVIARNLWKNHRILPPTSTFKTRWDLFMVSSGAQACTSRSTQVCRPQRNNAPGHTCPRAFSVASHAFHFHPHSSVRLDALAAPSGLLQLRLHSHRTYSPGARALAASLARCLWTLFARATRHDSPLTRLYTRPLRLSLSLSRAGAVFPQRHRHARALPQA